MHTHVSILPQTLLLSQLPFNMEKGFLSYTVGLCWLFILKVAGYTSPSQAPQLLFLPPSDAYVRSFLYLLYTLIKLYYTHKKRNEFIYKAETDSQT